MAGWIEGAGDGVGLAQDFYVKNPQLAPVLFAASPLLIRVAKYFPKLTGLLALIPPARVVVSGVQAAVADTAMERDKHAHAMGQEAVFALPVLSAIPRAARAFYGELLAFQHRQLTTQVLQMYGKLDCAVGPHTSAAIEKSAGLFKKIEALEVASPLLIYNRTWLMKKFFAITPVRNPASVRQEAGDAVKEMETWASNLDQYDRLKALQPTSTIGAMANELKIPVSEAERILGWGDDFSGGARYQIMIYKSLYESTSRNYGELRALYGP
ncbi:MAG: hypothetical protein R3C68_17415 [Myxococcota bacterium]